jgi:cytochrome b561
MKRYHPLLVTLHWLLAGMILFSLVVGVTILEETSNADPEKFQHLQIHSAMGAAILILMIVRLAVRIKKPRPAPLESGNAFLDRLATFIHNFFYVVVIAMALSGVVLSISTSLSQILFGGDGQPLPANFDGVLPRAVHGVLGTALMAMITLHLLGFVFRQFVRKDNVIVRMWFARNP